jgi:ribitol-5-phosphate 2-dehydrogenase (NADP+) / D-ribitol-5-phosphate cytidylyltransferase
MKKPVALIFGHNGGIGNATRNTLLKSGHRIVPVDRSIIDFNTHDADSQIDQLLTASQPDVIVNCTGVFENGFDKSHTKTMNVNFGSNWSIVRHYMNPRNQTKPVRIIMIGSSSYSKGKKLYPLYSASKAALYNLWEGARDALADSVVRIDLVNPVRTLTKMSTEGKQIDPNLDYLHPDQVAEEILKLVNDNLPSSCIDIDFEEKK